MMRHIACVINLIEKGNYLKERWYDSEGKAIKDRHHTDHGNLKNHPYNPHDQYWNWSNPNKPTLGKKSYSPSDSLDEPTENQEENAQNEPTENPNDNKSDAAKSEINETKTLGNTLKGFGIMGIAALGIAVLAVDDILGITIDDIALIPLGELFRQGSQLVWG